MTVGYFVRSKVVLLATLASLAVPALSFSEEQATPSGVEEAQVEEQTLAPEARTDVEPPPSPPVFSSPPRGVNRYDAMRAEPGTAVLNFNEAGIRDILRTIGELTGKNFILAPGVNARISVQTARPVPREEVFGIFESLLEVNGLAAVRSGKYYKIVPAASARQHSVAAAEDFGKGNPGSEEGMTSLVVPVEFISAADLMAVLKPMVSAAGNVTAVPRSNTVIITDSAPNVRNHLELIRILDVDAFERFEVSLLPLKNVDAKTMHRELAEVLAALGMGKDASQLAVIPIERLNSLVIISAPGGARESVARWVESLDVPSSSEQSSLHIYYVKNDKASNLKALLEQVYEGKKSIAVATASSAAGQPNTAAEAQAVSKSVSSGDKGISIYIYEPANALVVRSSQGEYLSVLEILKELDRPPRQVLIDALIAEVKLDESTRFGIQWSVLSGDFNIQHNTGLFSSVIQNPGAVTQTPIGAAAPAGLSVFATDSSRFFAAIQALATDGKVDILSNPHVVVKNYEKASISVGSDEPVSTQSSQTAVTGTSGIIQNIEYRKTGVILTVIPHITDSGMVALSIRQEVSDKSTDRTIGNATYPSFAKREAETAVVARDKETLVIGGLIQERFDNSSSGIPFFSKVPIIGNLFKSTANSRSKTELVILLKPTVLTSPEEAASATREFRDKLKAVKRQLKEY
jgi:general secretion pathway protein D